MTPARSSRGVDATGIVLGLLSLIAFVAATVIVIMIVYKLRLFDKVKKKGEVCSHLKLALSFTAWKPVDGMVCSCASSS